MSDVWIDCECTLADHAIRFSKDEHDVYICVSAKPCISLRRRIVFAIRYVLGLSCKYGGFAECLIVPGSGAAKKIQRMLERPPRLKNEDEYQQALKDVERLWSCTPGSPEEAELDRVADLIDEYESYHYR